MAVPFLVGAEPSAALVVRSLGIAALAGLALFFVRLFQARTRFRNAMKKYDIPTLPHSFLFGHLVVIGKALAGYPRDFGKLGMVYALTQAYPEIVKEGIVYFDPWPFGEQTAAAFDPEIMPQFTQDKSYTKSPMVKTELEPLTGLKDLSSMEGQEWKTWRSVFNPGFSAKNLTALVPAFLEEIQVLKERLVKVAGTGQVIKMEETIQRATVDVIFRAALGTRLHSQTSPNDFVTTLQNQIWWLVCDSSLPNKIKSMIPIRPFMLWWNNHKMKRYLTPLIENDIARLDRGEAARVKTINSLAVNAFRSEVQVQQQQPKAAAPPRVDPKFLDMAISQLKIFIFAGHDTTASTVSFAYSRIYRDRAVLARLRAEHDRVLGPDTSQAFARLAADPSLLSQLPYTSAVVKETLRLYPPAATARAGEPGGFLTSPAAPGRVYPTEGFMLWATHFAAHRLPEYWPRAGEFVPERWLVRGGADDPLRPRRNAWRPFELGPRNCIGQELAQVEMRAILAVTVRDLEVEPAYAPGAPEALGDTAYQTMGFGDITGHVKDGFPVRVRLSAGAS